MDEIMELKYFINGRWEKSASGKYIDICDPNAGKVIAKAPCCSKGEVNACIEAAKNAYPAWANTPVMKRVQVMYKFKELIEKHFDELTLKLCTENGKAWGEAAGDVQKMKECVEFSCGIPTLMMGESLMDTSSGYDCVLYREPMGVFAGIAPYNFPAMIPIGWMVPACTMTGNTFVLKASSLTPMTAMLCADLLKEAGMPDGVFNLVTCSRNEAELFLTHPDIQGITLVGSTAVGKHIFTVGSANGKRVQSCCEAKNHALVLEDAALERTASAIVNAAFGCAGQRCMALPAVAVQESVADRLINLVVEKAKRLIVGPAYDRASTLGPLVSSGQKKFVCDWIEKGISEGAKLLVDGRDVVVKGYENGFYVGPTIFDHVTSEMSIGDEEIFGPVLCFKRIKEYEEGIELINTSRFANGAAIFTQSGFYARDFAKRIHSGNTGINVGIPVPTAYFPFSGHKQSFFGTIHTIGKDSIRFYTETKVVSTTWFNNEEVKKEKVDTWGF